MVRHLYYLDQKAQLSATGPRDRMHQIILSSKIVFAFPIQQIAGALSFVGFFCTLPNDLASRFYGRSCQLGIVTLFGSETDYVIDDNGRIDNTDYSNDGFSVGETSAPKSRSGDRWLDGRSADTNALLFPHSANAIDLLCWLFSGISGYLWVACSMVYRLLSGLSANGVSAVVGPGSAPECQTGSPVECLSCAG